LFVQATGWTGRGGLYLAMITEKKLIQDQTMSMTMNVIAKLLKLKYFIGPASENQRSLKCY
jgi:hypothetical protein